jgi:hypothetical protein
MLKKQITHANRIILFFLNEQQENKNPLHPQQYQPMMFLFVENAKL